MVNDPGVGLQGEGGDRRYAQDVADEISAAGGRAVMNCETVATEAGALSMVRQAIDCFGRLDIVINNAGNFMPARPFEETTTDSFFRVWQVHVLGTVNVIRAAWPHLKAQGGGRIVNIGSHCGYIGWRGGLEYATAKGAIHGLTRSLAKEGADLGILVNTLAPGAVTRPVEALGFPDSLRLGAFSPDLVPPTLLWLVHEDCKVHGESFGVMAGSTTRICIAESQGYTSQSPTPETIRDNFSQIMATDVFASSSLVFGDDAEARGAEFIRLYGEHQV